MNSHTKLYVALDAEPFRHFERSPRGSRSAVFATPTADAQLQYVITEYFIPELAKITGRDLGFHFDDLIHLKLVLGWRSRYGR